MNLSLPFTHPHDDVKLFFPDVLMVIPKEKPKYIINGVVPSGRSTRTISYATEKQTPPPDFDDTDWLNVVIPPAFQSVGSCTVETAFNCAEILPRMFLGNMAFLPGEQYNATKAYWIKKQQYSEPDIDTGLQAINGFEAAIEQDYVPDDTKIEEFEPTPYEICERIKRGPFGIAMALGPNFYAENVDKHSGLIPYYRVTLANAIGYHAMCVVGVQWRNDTLYLWVVQSWPDWGYHSLGCMTLETYIQGNKWICGDGPHQFVFNSASVYKWSRDRFSNKKWKEDHIYKADYAK